MYSITQERPAADASLFDQGSFRDARARFRMGHGDSDSDLKNISGIKVLHARISETLFEAYGYHLDTIITILDLGRNWLLLDGEEIASVSIDEFLSRCAELAPDVPAHAGHVRRSNN